VVVLDSTNVALISDTAAQAQGAYTFQITGQAPPIDPGDVIVGVQDGGFLRRVSTVSRSENRISLVTTQAALTDVVTQGSLEDSVSLTIDEETESRGSSPNFRWGRTTLAVAANAGDAILVRNGEIILDGLTLIGTPQAGLTISRGRIRFNPSVKLSLRIKRGEIERLMGQTTGTVLFDAQSALGVNDALELADEKTLFTLKKPFVAFIGSMPVPGEVQLTFKAVAKLGAEAALSVTNGFRSSGTVMVGGTYTRSANPSWSLIKGSTTSFTAEPLSFSAPISGFGEVGGKVELRLSLFNVPGPYLYVGASGRVARAVDFIAQQSYDRCTAAVDGGVGFDVRIFSSVLAQFVASDEFYSNTFCQHDSPVELPTASVSVDPPSASITVGAAVQLTAILRDQAGNPVSGGPVTWSSSDSGVARVSATGVVMGVAPGGPITITAASGNVSGQTSVTVTVGGATRDVAQLALGSAHSCALIRDGAVFCWGGNHAGQLGNGTTTTFLAATPVPTRAVGLPPIRALTAGQEHTCALAETGTAFCWGRNDDGQLGDGTRDDRAAPTPVAGGLTFRALAAGFRHTCGLTDAGDAYCWGENGRRQLGDGEQSPWRRSHAAPVRVDGGHRFIAIGGGQSHTCGVTDAGALYCWGDNTWSQYGIGRLTGGERTPVRASGDQTFATVEPGGLNTCGITRDGAAFCWGRNDEGQAGVGRDIRTPYVPTPVLGGHRFAVLAAWTYHTCGVTTEGRGYCWGLNGLGALGDGSGLLTATYEPSAVSGGYTFTQIGAGGGHTCGVTNGGEVLCWGANGRGQLGDGTTGQHYTPVAVRFP